MVFFIEQDVAHPVKKDSFIFYFRITIWHRQQAGTVAQNEYI